MITQMCAYFSKRWCNPLSILFLTLLSCSMAQVHAALQALLDSNAQWARDVDVAEPDFFQQSAKGQSPQVRPSGLLAIATFFIYCRSCGSAALILESQSLLSQVLVLEIFSSIGTSQSEQRQPLLRCSILNSSPLAQSSSPRR